MTNAPVTKEEIESRLSEGLNEETVCARSVVPYIRHILGWNITDIYAEYIVHSSTNKKVDYAVPNKQQPKLLIEAKSLGTDLKKNRDQLSEYLDLSNVDYGVLTDGLNFEVMERNEKSQNEIIDTFLLTDNHPKLIENNGSTETQENLEQDPSKHIKNIFPDSFSEEMIQSLEIQHNTGLSDELNPLHTYIAVDATMVETIREGLYNICENSVYIKSHKRSDSNIIKTCQDPNILIYDNVDANSIISKRTMLESFSSIEFKKPRSLPKNIPLIVLDTPKDGHWNDFDTVSMQLDVEPSVIQSFDLVFAPRNSQKNKKGRNIAESYLDTIEYNKKLKVNSKNINIETDPDIPDNVMELMQEFFVSIKGENHKGTLPISFERINSIVKISKGVAYKESSSLVKKEHFDRARNIILESMRDISYEEEESDRFDNNLIDDIDQDGTAKERENKIINIIENNQEVGDKGAPIDLILKIMTEKYDFEEDKVSFDLRKMGRNADEIYEPRDGEFRLL